MVAFEVAYSAALAGKRAMTIAKHLGTYWIVDPLMVSVLTGVNGPLVIVTADDTHPYSSQNAGDTRYIARMAKLPELEPTDVQEAKEVTKYAFKLSEKVKLPVFVRLTHRLAHERAPLILGQPETRAGEASFKKNDDRYVSWKRSCPQRLRQAPSTPLREIPRPRSQWWHAVLPTAL